MSKKIAVAITTRNRPDAFKTSYEAWKRELPDGASLFVVDDDSDQDYANADYRFDSRVGIPKAKNKCLELCMESGADYIFLADDDIYPKVKGWHLPYINSGEHHLAYCFSVAYGTTPARPPKIVLDGENLTSSQRGNGCMMFFTRECILTAGVFNEAFGLGFFEHNELSNRIHRLGLTTVLYGDVLGSERLFHSMDEHGEVKRSFTDLERVRLIFRNQDLYNEILSNHEYKRADSKS